MTIMHSPQTSPAKHRTEIIFCTSAFATNGYYAFYANAPTQNEIKK